MKGKAIPGPEYEQGRYEQGIVFYEETPFSHPHLQVTNKSGKTFYLVYRPDVERFQKVNTVYHTKKESPVYFELPGNMWVGPEPERLLKMALSYLRRMHRD